jgi:hypothetical protein
MSLPSRSEFSPAPSASLISQLALYNRGCAFSALLRAIRKLFSSHLAMFWRLRAFLEFPGPSAIVPMQRLCKFHLRVTHYHQAYLTWFRYVLGLSQPLDASFRIGLSDLVSCRCRPWASIVLRRFLPTRSPRSLSARSVLRVVISFGFLAVTALDRLRGCQHRMDALSSLRVFSALRRSLLPWSFSPSRC